MRNMRLFCVFTALLNQVEALETDTQLMEQARTVGIMEGTTYLYIRWDAELRRHIRADQQPLEHAEARAVPEGPQVPDGLPERSREVPCAAHNDSRAGVRHHTSFAHGAESQQLYALMMRLSRNGLWQLIGASMRPAKPGRSPLCRQLNRFAAGVVGPDTRQCFTSSAL